MATYVILSRFSPEAFGDPTEFKPLAAGDRDSNRAAFIGKAEPKTLLWRTTK
jgi:hypothetical protein